MTNNIKKQSFAQATSFNSGFTLIETLLYLAIVGSMLLVIAGFLAVLVQTRIKHQTITEVEQQGNFIMRVLARDLKNAQTINSPAAGDSDSELSVNLKGGLDNPVVFSVVDAVLGKTAGLQSAINLTSPNVEVSQIIFTNVSSGAAEAVKVDLQLTYKNLIGRNEYSYQANFSNSISLRK